MLPEYQENLCTGCILFLLWSIIIKSFFPVCRWETSESGVGYYVNIMVSWDHVVKNFFTNNYPEPIIDNGIPCVDMTYLYLEIR